MPVCGFNNEMIEGFELFEKGLKISLEKRAKELGLDSASALETEIEDMNRFLEELEANPSDTAMKEKLVGILLYARASYKQANGDYQPEKQFIQTKKMLIGIDDYYYKVLDGNSKRMDELAMWVEKNYF